jgi:hypothetical protein
MDDDFEKRRQEAMVKRAAFNACFDSKWPVEDDLSHDIHDAAQELVDHARDKIRLERLDAAYRPTRAELRKKAIEWVDAIIEGLDEDTVSH